MVRIEPETLKKILDLFNGFIDGIERATESIQNLSNSLAQESEPQPSPQVIVEKVEYLPLRDLSSIIKAHRPTESDGVATVKKESKDKIQLYLTYVKGKELVKDSPIIVISAEAIAKEIDKQLENNKVVILK